jgi:hypothetical protein
MAKHRARCSCGLDLWAKRQGQMTLKTKILKVDSAGGIHAKCPKCDDEVPVPFLILAPEAAPTIAVVRLDVPIPT